MYIFINQLEGKLFSELIWFRVDPETVSWCLRHSDANTNVAVCSIRSKTY